MTRRWARLEEGQGWTRPGGLGAGWQHQPQFPHLSAVSGILPSAVTACSQPGWPPASPRLWPAVKGTSRGAWEGTWGSVGSLRTRHQPLPQKPEPCKRISTRSLWPRPRLVGQAATGTGHRPPFPAPVSSPSAPRRPEAWHTQGVPRSRWSACRIHIHGKTAPPKHAAMAPCAPGVPGDTWKPRRNRTEPS